MDVNFIKRVNILYILYILGCYRLIPAFRFIIFLSPNPNYVGNILNQTIPHKAIGIQEAYLQRITDYVAPIIEEGGDFPDFLF